MEAGAAAEDALGQDGKEMEDADDSVDIRVVGSPCAARAASGSILGGASANGNGFLRGYEHVPAVPSTAQDGLVQDMVVADDTSAGEPLQSGYTRADVANMLRCKSINILRSPQEGEDSCLCDDPSAGVRYMYNACWQSCSEA